MRKANSTVVSGSTVFHSAGHVFGGIAAPAKSSAQPSLSRHERKQRCRFSSLLARHLTRIVVLVGMAYALPGLAACQQISIPISYISSWDSHGFQNRVRYDESFGPDHLAGKGPYSDRFNYGSGRLMVSYNVLAFQIPQLTGTVATA